MIDPLRWWVAPRWGGTWSWFCGYAPSYYNRYPYYSSWTTYGYTVPSPVYYNYGDNIVYRGDMVYLNGVPYVSADKYYEQSLELAKRGGETTVVRIEVPQNTNVETATDAADFPATQDANANNTVAASADPSEDWMPFGTFAVLKDGEKEDFDQVLQLATNRGGIVRGNFYDEKTDQLQPVEGAIDHETQRVAFHATGDETRVYECGLWNLTQESLPLLVHEGKEKTEMKKLVRLQDPQAKESDAKTPEPASPDKFEFPTPSLLPTLD